MAKPGRKAPKRPPADPDRFEEAIRAWRRRVPMTEDAWERLAEAEREFAFTVSGVTEAEMVQQVFDAIDRAVADGTTLETFKREVGAALEAAWGGADPYRVETTFRTNVLGAYNAGRHEIMTAPEVRRSRPYWRFDAVMDSRVSPICEELDGIVRPADDPFWRNHTPPLHHGCRSVLTPLTLEEAEDEGIDIRVAPDNAPSPGFGRAPVTEGTDWKPNLRRFDPEIREVLQERVRR